MRKWNENVTKMERKCPSQSETDIPRPNLPLLSRNVKKITYGAITTCKSAKPVAISSGKFKSRTESKFGMCARLNFWLKPKCNANEK